MLHFVITQEDVRLPRRLRKVIFLTPFTMSVLKRYASFVTLAAMLVSLFPATAFAESDAESYLSSTDVCTVDVDSFLSGFESATVVDSTLSASDSSQTYWVTADGYLTSTGATNKYYVENGGELDSSYGGATVFLEGGATAYSMGSTGGTGNTVYMESGSTLQGPGDGQIFYVQAGASLNVGSSGNHAIYYENYEDLVEIGTGSILYKCGDISYTKPSTDYDPTNNAAASTDSSMPDLVVDDISLDGDLLTVAVTNQGDAAVETTDFHVYIYIDDMNNAAWTYSVSTLADQDVVNAGGTSTIQPQTLSEGSHEIKVYVDPAEVIEESDESNNSLQETLTVAGADGEDGADEDVEDGDLPDGFLDEWNKLGFKHTYYLTVQWGNFNLEDDEALKEAGTTSTWDGDVAFEGDFRGKPVKLLGFEWVEDWINWDETDPKNTSFDSIIHWGHDGIAFKVKADLDGDETPTLVFETDDDALEPVEVTLEEILATTSTGKAWTYSYNGSDDKTQDLVINAFKVDDWAKRFHSHVLLQTRIGNLDGNGSGVGETELYTVNLSVNEDSVIKKYRGFILEDHTEEGYDTIVGDEDSVTLYSAIGGYQDGMLTWIKLLEADSDDERSVTLTVTDNDTGTVVFEKTFTQEEDLGVFDLDDGTGNQIEIKNFLRHKNMSEEEVEEWFDKMMATLEKATENDVSIELETFQEETKVMGDVEVGSWYEGHTQAVIAAGIFGGYKDAQGNSTGKFGPGDNITRFQLLKVMYELSDELDMGIATLGCDPDTVTLTSEVDWMEDHWATGYVQCIYDSGMAIKLLEEVIDESLQEGLRPAFRWEVMSTAGEMLDIEADAPSEATFDDVTSSGLPENVQNWTQLYTDQGIISGNPDGTFKPFRWVNRAEMAKIISLFMEVYS